MLSNFGYDDSAGGYRNDKHIRTVADVNGDGLADIVAFGGAGVYVALAHKGINIFGFNQPFDQPFLWLNDFGSDMDAGNFVIDKNPRLLADVNGDGRVDICGFDNEGFRVDISPAFCPVK